MSLRLVLALLLPGCAYVTDAAELARIDPDGDGVTLDDDCDSSDPSVSAVRRWFADADADGYGDAASPLDACAQPAGYVAQVGDCDDTRADVHPGAEDPCDGVDQDCDGAVDPMADWYVDADADGYGTGPAVQACAAPAGYAAQAGDCDDADPAVSPAAVETCATPYDDDCDGRADGAADAPVWYADHDADGFGDAAVGLAACDAPEGYVADDTDCDDAAPEVSPAGVEVCGGADEDCDTLLDDADPDVTGRIVWYTDADGDGHGAPGAVAEACAAPAGTVGIDDDCDDADAGAHPGALEACATAADDDCDGAVNEVDAFGCTPYFTDADRDGYGVGASACLCAPEGDTDSVIDGDCDDADPGVNPGAVEVWYDGVDQDCSGGSDADADADGHDAIAAGGDDCDDADPAVSPAATEVCNDGVDNDCDGGGGACVLSASVDALDADGVVYGDALDLAYGSAASIGPVDASGTPGLLVGAPGWRADDGAAYTYASPPLGVWAAGTYEDRMHGHAGGRLGAGVVLGGGGAVYLAEPFNDAAPNPDGGLVWALASPGTALAEDLACQRLYPTSGVSTGVLTVAVADDQDGDGAAEVVVGAPGYSWAAEGDGLVAWSSSTACGDVGLGADVGWYGAGAGAELGTAVALGDLTGDGVADVVAGAPGDEAGAGAVYVFELASLGYVDAASAATLRMTGLTAGDAAGSAVAVVPDLTGDGLDDLLVGAPWSSAGGEGAGQAYLVPGGWSGTGSLDLAQAVVTGGEWTHLGSAFAAPDLDADGTSELAIGAPGDASGASTGADAGHVYVYSGVPAGSYGPGDAAITLTGTASDQLGAALAAGDLDGDGILDLAVGAPGSADWYGAGAGAAYVWYGSGL